LSVYLEIYQHIIRTQFFLLPESAKSSFWNI
jgi:hypothetical protein